MSSMAPPNDMFGDLTGKVITITGGSRGLGKEMAFAFLVLGPMSLSQAERKKNCEALAEEIMKETGVEALPAECHVGEWDQCDALFEKVY